MKAADWTEAEIGVVREHLGDCTAKTTHEQFLADRTTAAIANMRHRIRQEDECKPAVKAPGDYVETLAGLLVDEFDCMEVWARWNGYASYRVLSRDRSGYCTLLCTAKGELAT